MLHRGYKWPILWPGWSDLATLASSVKSLRHLPKHIRLLLAIVSALVVGLWTWQYALIEVVESHDVSADCEDDEDGPCDCGANCHCCIACAHAGFSALPAEGACRLSPVGECVELPRPGGAESPQSRERGRPRKVPKQVLV